MQNGSNLEICTKGLFIHTFELKLWHLEVFPYNCTRKPYVCNVLRPHATWRAWSRTHKHDEHYPLCSNKLCMPLGIVSRHCVATSAVAWTGFFFCLCQLRYLKKKMLTNPSLCMQYRITHNSEFALGDCACILHTNLRSWLTST